MWVDGMMRHVLYNCSNEKAINMMEMTKLIRRGSVR